MGVAGSTVQASSSPDSKDELQSPDPKEQVTSSGAKAELKRELEGLPQARQCSACMPRNHARPAFTCGTAAQWDSEPFLQEQSPKASLAH